MIKKICTSCGQNKPWTNEFFHFYNEESGLLHSKCKPCSNKQVREIKARKDAAEKEILGRVSWLHFTCTACSCVFPHWFKASGGKSRCKPCETGRREGVSVDQEKRNRSFMVAKAQHMRKYCHIYMCPTCGISGAENLFTSRIKKQVSECKKCMNATNSEYRKTTEGKAKRNQQEKNRLARKAGFSSHADRLDAYSKKRAIRKISLMISRIAKNKKESEPIKPWQEQDLTPSEKYRIRYRLDNEFNLKERMRRQITKHLKRDGIASVMREAIKRNGESNAVHRALGYTIAELKTHIERQFIDGMTWDRFISGEIHIDHITPQAAFDLQNDNEWRACWSLGNLRPLWGVDNLKKLDKLHFLL